MGDIAANIAAVRDRAQKAAERAGRQSDSVTLIAVTKTVGVERMREALATGVTELGENRVQELLHKQDVLGSASRWHLIGSLQTNKVKYCMGTVDLIHSLDRDSLAWELAKQSGKTGTEKDVLIQVNVAREESKHGVTLDELDTAVKRWSQMAGIHIRGLMTIAPFADDPESARPVFRSLREASERLRSLDLSGVEMKILSMGMTNDFEVAVEEGATHIRVGSAIFGDRG